MGRDDGRPAYFQNFTFSVQRELPASMLAEASYVGVKGTRLSTNLIHMNEVNPRYLSLGSLLTRPAHSAEAQAPRIALPYTGFSGSVAQALRPYPLYGSIRARYNPNGNSTCHAVQTKLDKRFSKGFSVLAAYTWSKTISDADILAGLGPSGQTFYNRALEKAISTNGIPHNVALSYVWDLPFGPGRRYLPDAGVLDKVIGGWTFTGIHQYSTSRPIVLGANNTLPTFNLALRPDVIAGVERQIGGSGFDPQTDRWINPGAFAPVTGLRFGTAARSCTDLRAPSWRNESFGLIKRTPITENVRLTFRAEFFNVFNRVVFAALGSNVSSANFGRIARQANTPRQGQLALRLEF